MTRRFGLLGHENMGIVMATALIAGMEHAKRKPRPKPTPEQIAAADKRDERRRWNDEVAARKAAKKKNKQEPA